MISDKFRNMLQFYKPNNIHLKMIPPPPSPKTLKFKCDVIFMGYIVFITIAHTEGFACLSML